MKFLRFWFPVLIYSGIIFYASSIPNVSTPLPEIAFDKILHILVYMPFGILLGRAVRNSYPLISTWILILLIFGITLFYGMSDEFHQSLVVGRSANVLDLTADVLGGVLGGYLYCRFANKKNRKLWNK